MIEEESGDRTDYDDADAESSRTACPHHESRPEVWYKFAMQEEPYMYCRSYNDEKEREVLHREGQSLHALTQNEAPTAARRKVKKAV